MLSNKKIGWVIRLLVISALGLSIYLQANTGMADNGDFSRIMGLFTSGPTGFTVNWPPPNTEEWQQRFFNYWLPYWKLDFPGTPQLFSSVLVLWLPGIFLNYLTFSRSVLNILFVSLTPALLIMCFLFVTMQWIDKSYESMRNLLFVTAGVPLVLVLSDGNYLSFFKSFYQETASIIFALSILIVIVRRYSGDAPSPSFYVISFLVTFLMATAKASTFYLPFIVFPFLFPFRDNIWRKPGRLGLAVTLFVVIPAAFSLLFCSTNLMRKANSYHRIFLGALAFSSSPQSHLQRLGIRNGLERIDKEAYTKESEEFIQKNADRLSYRNYAGIIVHEPALIFRMIAYAAGHMQAISSTESLKKHVNCKQKAGDIYGFDCWTNMKARFFPKGAALLASLAIMCASYTILLWARWRHADISVLSVIGLFTATACFADLVVAIFGEGKADMEKHLILSNLFFDLSVIAFTNILIIFILSMATRKRVVQTID